MTNEEIRLVERTMQGDEKGYEALVRLMYARLYALAQTILKDRGEAEDALQQTLITIWQKKEDLREPAAFGAWAHSIVRNTCYMELRKKNRPLPVDDESPVMTELEDSSLESIPAVYAEREDLKQRLGAIIEQLSPLQGQALVLFYFGGMTLQEIAEVTETTPDVVKQRLFQARKSIKTKILAEEERTGERFYGVGGLALISLGEALAPHFAFDGAKAAALEQALQALSSKMSGTGGAAAAGKAGAVSAKGSIPLVAKVIAGVAAVAVIAGGAIGVITFLNSDPEQLPTEETIVVEDKETSEVTHPADTADTADEVVVPVEVADAGNIEEELWTYFLGEDFTVVAGRWVNNWGEGLTIYSDGIVMFDGETYGDNLSDNGYVILTSLNNPSKQENYFDVLGVVYAAGIAQRITDPADLAMFGMEFYPGGAGVVFFPTGFDIVLQSDAFRGGEATPYASDTSQIRMFIGQYSPTMLVDDPYGPGLYYRVSTG